MPINNDSVFSAIEYKDGFATLYFKEPINLQENDSSEAVEKYAENKLFAILLEIVKSTGAQRFETRIDESYIASTKKLYMSCHVSVGISCSATVQVCRADGSIITEEENRQMLLEHHKTKMEQIILNSIGNMIIQEQDHQRIIKLFKVEDHVIILITD